MFWPIAISVLAGLLLGLIATLVLARVLRASVQEQAAQALRDNADMFLKLASQAFKTEQATIEGHWQRREQALQALVDPIRSALQKTEQQVEKLERERREAFATLRTQIETLAQGQSTLQRETQNLVTALRRPEVRGRWGEMTLRRIVELAGLSEHCDFIEQPSVMAAAGVLRPDLIVNMPEGRQLVVDAKTPLDAYLEAIDAATEAQRAQALARHARQVEARVRELATKAYWLQFDRSPEFAVLFLPGDQFLSTALAQRPELLENAIRSGVIVATPSTLIALLKTVAYGWRQAAVADNAARIRDLGQELHRRLASFVGHVSKLGRALNSTVQAHNDAVGSLERQVLPGARKFTELGAAIGDPIASLEPVEHLAREIPNERAAP
jgi:DNA recombination protein RmuC